MLKIKDMSKAFELQMDMIRKEFSSMLIATLSHETMTPLNAIINFADLLKKSHEKQLEIFYQKAQTPIKKRGSVRL